MRVFGEKAVRLKRGDDGAESDDEGEYFPTRSGLRKIRRRAGLCMMRGDSRKIVHLLRGELAGGSGCGRGQIPLGGV